MDNQSHNDNNINNINICCACNQNNETIKTVYYFPKNQICGICNKNEVKEEFYLMNHKWREYGGYSQGIYSRHVCSKECLEIYERDYRCNYCHIITYEWNDYKKGPDGFTYCDNDELTVGDKPCYYLKFGDEDYGDENNLI